MNLKCIAGFLSIFVFVVGCGGNAKVVTDDVNGANDNRAKLAVFAEKIEFLNVDADGINDFKAINAKYDAEFTAEFCDAIFQ